jgi:hypothetical protein
VRTAARLVLVAAVFALAACAASESSSPDLTGPYPSVTAVIRADADGGRLDLVGAQVSAVDLRTAATQMAIALFGAENVGEATPTSADTGAIPETLLSTTVPVTIPTEGTQLAIDGTAVDEALRLLKPRSTALWACSDRRTIQVAAQAPGAVSSDVVSGVCQAVGSSIAKDGVDWTATVAIGPVTEASLLPVLAGSTILLLIVAGLVALLWIRRARRRSEVRPSDPAPVH